MGLCSSYYFWKVIEIWSFKKIIIKLLKIYRIKVFVPCNGKFCKINGIYQSSIYMNLYEYRI